VPTAPQYDHKDITLVSAQSYISHPHRRKAGKIAVPPQEYCHHDRACPRYADSGVCAYCPWLDKGYLSRTTRRAVFPEPALTKEPSASTIRRADRRGPLSGRRRQQVMFGKAAVMSRIAAILITALAGAVCLPPAGCRSKLNGAKSLRPHSTISCDRKAPKPLSAASTTISSVKALTSVPPAAMNCSAPKTSTTPAAAGPPSRNRPKKTRWNMPKTPPVEWYERRLHAAGAADTSAMSSRTDPNPQDCDTASTQRHWSSNSPGSQTSSKVCR